nr:PREDICTED: RNA pseudouridine synthase 3, mitochondrial isoform X2 [Daucus carota subsp. sativus]
MLRALSSTRNNELPRRYYSRISIPPRNCTPKSHTVVRVSPKTNIAHLGPPPKNEYKPRQLLSLPPFPCNHQLPSLLSSRVTAIMWMKFYFQDIEAPVIQSHFNKGLVHIDDDNRSDEISLYSQGKTDHLRKIKHSEVMKTGARIYVPVSVAETRISNRFNSIPTGTLYPNADEIEYLQRLVKYKDSAIIVLNKPPKLPVKGNLPVHNSMDALAAAALSYDYDEGPKLVHRLDRESSGIHLMGRTKESIAHLQWLFSSIPKGKSSDKKYWALVIGSPKEKEGLIRAPLTKVLLNDGKTERVILAHGSGLEASQEAVTEYRVLGPMINGCSWIELLPLTSRKDQIRVHCAEALGTPIVGDYKYGWFTHRRWKQMPRVDFEPTSGKPYKMRRPDGLDVQKGSVLSKVPLLHMHCRELVLPNIAKFIQLHKNSSEKKHKPRDSNSKPDLLRFVVSMPSHMKISWNLMSSYLV